jgi:hypothetical protein
MSSMSTTTCTSVVETRDAVRASQDGVFRRGRGTPASHDRPRSTPSGPAGLVPRRKTTLTPTDSTTDLHVSLPAREADLADDAEACHQSGQQSGRQISRVDSRVVSRVDRVVRVDRSAEWTECQQISRVDSRVVSRVDRVVSRSAEWTEWSADQQSGQQSGQQISKEMGAGLCLSVRSTDDGSHRLLVHGEGKRQPSPKRIPSGVSPLGVCVRVCVCVCVCVHVCVRPLCNNVSPAPSLSLSPSPCLSALSPERITSGVSPLLAASGVASARQSARSCAPSSIATCASTWGAGQGCTRGHAGHRISR